MIDFSKYPSLNLSESRLRMKQDAENRVSVWDVLRRKYVVLTPEEWVRQHFVAFLSEVRGYALSSMANEVTLNVNGAIRRCDTVIFDKQRRPAMVIEYKAADVVITQAVFDQIARYNMVLNAPYLVVSNGLNTFCCRYNQASATYSFLSDLPEYSAIIE